MKPGWKTVKVGDVCAIEFGERVVRKNDSGTLYPVYGGGGATFSIDRYNRESCVVVARFGMSERCVRFVDGRFFLNDSGLTVSATSAEVFQGYIDLLLHAKAPEIYALGSGTAQKNLDTKRFRELEIPLPPLAEQKRIVALLDEAFAGIDKAKANTEGKISVLSAYLNSIWAKILPETLVSWPEAKSSLAPVLPTGWKMLSIEDLSHKGAPVRYGILQPGPDVEGGVAYVRPTEIVNDEIPEGTLRRTTREIASMYSRSVLKADDVILTIVGTIGKVALVPDWLEGGNITQSSARIRGDASVVRPQYLALLLRSPLAKRQFEHYRMGAAVTRLNIADVKRLRVPIPSLDTQDLILERFNEYKACLDVLNQNSESSLTALKSFKSSLLNQAFSGAL